MNVELWAQERLRLITNGMFSDEDIKQMVSLSFTLPVEEVREYFLGMLGDSPDTNQFLDEFTLKRQPKQLQGAWKVSRDPFVYLKEKLTEFDEAERKMIVEQAKQMPSSEMQEYFKSLLGDDEHTRRFLLQFQGILEKEETKKANQVHKLNPKAKKKNKVVKMERVGNAQPRDGREICECMAAVHDLVTNCLECGKIICAYEGKEICPWCGAPIQFQTTNDVVLLKAQERKETLLDYDKNSTARTHVTDLASDFDVGADKYNKWLTPEQRALALKREQEQKRLEEEQKSRRVLTIDLENKTAKIEKPVVKLDPHPQEEKPVEYVGYFRNPNLTKPAPKFIPLKQKKPKLKREQDTLLMCRLQDDVQFFSKGDMDADEYEPDCSITL